MLTGAKGGAWKEAARVAAERCGVKVEVHAVGAVDDVADADGIWAGLKQIEDDGAVLVRPDVHVGWRAATLPADPAQALSDAISRILDRPDA